MILCIHIHTRHAHAKGGEGAAAPAQQGGEEEEEEEEEEDQDVATPWTGLAKLPERSDVLACLRELKDVGFKQLNVLLLGKSSVGKSSTVNSLLGETVARVQAFKLQADAEIISPFVKEVQENVGPEAAGMRIKLIDTVGLEDAESGDAVNLQALRKIADSIKGQSIDVVLYVDRLDLYRVDALDKGIMQAVSDTFGKSIWKKTVLVLTHGNLVQPPPGSDFDSFADRRVKALRGAIRGRSPFFRPRLLAVLVENNNDTCPTDKDGRRLLPDGSQWVPSLIGSMTDMAMGRRAYRYKPSMTRRPNAQLKWLMPLVAAGQYFLWKEVIRAQLDRDDEDDAAANELIWSEKAKERKDLGIGPPLRPNKIDSWRLEQMYDDD
ncbi:TOC34f [Dunaliella salina]|uniref:TOC34f n=1 Tax=Dunaliella salina TaxID=3046 RepID=A0ABQ7GM13_DUNSA|nr:TOC34f [Dunaliella salina]|eukprot:KAF5835650.1 TOC34f [Dunaliella salina]